MKKCIDCVFGIRSRGRRIEGTDELRELLRPVMDFFYATF